MSVLRPRNRLVNFRLSDEEFRSMEQACALSGARSLSDFARGAVLGAISVAGHLHHHSSGDDSKSEPLARLDHVAHVVGDLELRVEHLLQLFDRVRVTAETSPQLNHSSTILP